ncbi:bolA-like protein 3 [Daktulosphaira vitifoliae]|uniref:bolA-like protein 3 n=1 Tax=Daktulosphaira vitifoliae TaxID=58002 RepID=UPI0021AAEAD3|nr:bolA-like protein 3 [Daktulosphaira vitifoliae]
MFYCIKRSIKAIENVGVVLKNYSNGTNVATLKGGEKILHQSLQKKFPLAKEIKIKDISGGCGAIFEVYVSSTEFKGLSIVKQHQVINEVLKNEIKSMHGIRIHTEIPSE